MMSPERQTKTITCSQRLLFVVAFGYYEDATVLQAACLSVSTNNERVGNERGATRRNRIKLHYKNPKNVTDKHVRYKRESVQATAEIMLKNCCSTQNVTEIGQSAAELWPKTIVTWWPSAILNLNKRSK